MDNKEKTELRVPILTYHSIDNSGSVISTVPEKFRQQMHYLAGSSFNVISLKEIIQCLRENQPFPQKAVAITFDDGFKNIYDAAYPLLRELGFKATVFLVSGYCGRNNQWHGQPKGIPALDLLNWDEIAEMADDGIDFGAHTNTHPDLTTSLPEEAVEEIVSSKALIQRRIEKEVLFFAYPYGGQTETIKGIVRDQFAGACSTELDFVTFKSDIYSLPRIDMYYFSKNNLFSWLGTSVFSFYIKFRNILRVLKSRRNYSLD